MPELPDLQVFRKNLEKKFGGKKLIKVTIASANKVSVPQTTLKEKSEGKKLKSINREGKELFFPF